MFYKDNFSTVCDIVLSLERIVRNATAFCRSNKPTVDTRKLTHQGHVVHVNVSKWK